MIIPGSGAIVTGASSGLGSAVARMLASHGALVGLFDIDQEHGQLLANETGARFFCTDVIDASQVTEAVEDLAEMAGNLRICVNCAGVAVAATVTGRTGPHDFDLFRKTLDINLAGTFNVMRVVATRMKQSTPLDDDERGVIINTSSVAGFDGQIGQGAYAASKAGVAGMTLPSSRELGRFGIRVVSIAPGVFDTPMLESIDDRVRDELVSSIVFPKRFGQPDEFAELVRFLIGCRYMNGTTIRIDGGTRLPYRS